MKPIVQYRYKGRLISHTRAARIGNLPAASKYLTTYYREKYRGPSTYKGEGYQHGIRLLTSVAMTKDRQEREERIERRRQFEERGRSREVERRIDYERRRIEYPGEEEEEEGEFYPEVPVPPEHFDEEEYDLGLEGGPIEDWEYDEMDDYGIEDEWDVADIDDEDKYGGGQQ